MAEPGRILLVDDDADLRRLLSLRLTSAGHWVEAAGSGRQALAVLTREPIDVVVTDLRMDGMDGIELLEELARRRPTLPVIVLTAHGTIPDAVTATQRGALDFLTKPVDKGQLLDRIERALGAVSAEVDSDAQTPRWADEIVTRSPRMRELLSEARLVADSDAAVLIAGESGTGKELLARAVHRASSRHAAPFVAINCAAMPESLLESELFGHERGAFTDAKQAAPGLFRSAEGGTVFLDEIGDMPASLQAKLLRVLQERKVRPVGGSREVPVDVRVISATHRDLAARIANGSFREDLYYRLNVVGLILPPLRDRSEDIPLLANHFLRQIAARQGTDVKVYAPDAMELLATAPWPGNIRELANVIEQNVALTRGRVISAEQVRKSLGDDAAGGIPPLQEARDAFTRDYLDRLLQLTEGNVARAARLAHRNRTEFYKLLSRHGLHPRSYKTD